jgi:hypothetical protein
MNQLKAWGFSAQWWRGERGEYWVIAQSQKRRIMVEQ